MHSCIYTLFFSSFFFYHEALKNHTTYIHVQHSTNNNQHDVFQGSWPSKNMAVPDIPLSMGIEVSSGLPIFMLRSKQNGWRK